MSHAERNPALCMPNCRRGAHDRRCQRLLPVDLLPFPLVPSPERATVPPSPMRPSAAQPVTEDPLRDAHEDRRSARNADPTPLDKDGQAAGGIGQGGNCRHMWEPIADQHRLWAVCVKCHAEDPGSTHEAIRMEMLSYLLRDDGRA